MNDDKKIKWILVILLMVFILGSLGIFFYQKNRYKEVYFEYNGFVVHKGKDRAGNTVYQTKIFLGDSAQPYLITTRYSPKELEEIKTIYYKPDLLNKKEIYITMDPSATAISVLAATEISKITSNLILYSIPTHGAFTSPSKDWPVKTCSNVNENQAIVFLKQSDQSRIYSENGCIIVEGKDEYDLIRVANKLVFTLLGVMVA